MLLSIRSFRSCFSRLHGKPLSFRVRLVLLAVLIRLSSPRFRIFDTGGEECEESRTCLAILAIMYI